MSEATTQQTIPITTGEDAHVTWAGHNARSNAHPLADNASQGMTLREYIATHVLNGLLSGRVLSEDGNGPLNAAAEAVEYADALLLTLERTPFGASSPVPSGDI